MCEPQAAPFLVSRNCTIRVLGNYARQDQASAPPTFTSNDCVDRLLKTHKPRHHVHFLLSQIEMVKLSL